MSSQLKQIYLLLLCIPALFSISSCSKDDTSLAKRKGRMVATVSGDYSRSIDMYFPNDPQNLDYGGIQGSYVSYSSEITADIKGINGEWRIGWRFVGSLADIAVPGTYQGWGISAWCDLVSDGAIGFAQMLDSANTVTIYSVKPGNTADDKYINGTLNINLQRPTNPIEHINISGEFEDVYLVKY